MTIDEQPIEASHIIEFIVKVKNMPYDLGGGKGVIHRRRMTYHLEFEEDGQTKGWWEFLEAEAEDILRSTVDVIIRPIGD
jgi:hypothetical protein